MKALEKIENRVNLYIESALVNSDENILEAFQEVQRGIETVKCFDFKHSTKEDFDDAFFSEFDKADLLEDTLAHDELREIQHDLVSFFTDYSEKK